MRGLRVANISGDAQKANSPRFSAGHGLQEEKQGVNPGARSQNSEARSQKSEARMNLPAGRQAGRRPAKGFQNLIVKNHNILQSIFKLLGYRGYDLIMVSIILNFLTAFNACGSLAGIMIISPCFKE